MAPRMTGKAAIPQGDESFSVGATTKRGAQRDTMASPQQYIFLAHFLGIV